MNKNRLEAFSDGVFAIAITLLILNVKIPQANYVSGQQLYKVLHQAIPKLLTFAFTFLVIGVFWIAHHRIFAFAKVTDSILMWINIVYLMFIALIPYPAALLAENPYLPITIIIYSSTLFVIAVMHLILLEYIIRNNHTRHEILTDEVYRSAQKTALVGPVCYVLAAAGSYIHFYISFFFILSAMVYYIFFAGHAKMSQELVKIGETTKEEEGK
ncbi:DUF1211 domain-containing protein [Mucilaginibacter robiniae]|uniref:DUF1211 domain-containing protein n=1 Tax=Mucilaginibacter robiniae TaxID=2728022 RepID=A0A7L5E3I0_9SPHI|nr:TMEM175 family protein [Mucilaginibacter robiniae]QJD97138.1 DUF1211 domain-containing protein [Mucilaginibacter robiniae]